MQELGSRYPRVAEYLNALPEGIESYPECMVRSGVVETFLSAAPEEPRDPAPPRLVAGLLHVPDRMWAHEVAFQAALLAIADRARMKDAAFLAWTRAANRQLYRGLIYRALMAFISPAALLERGATRWSAFRRGSTLEVARDGERSCTARLAFPPRLFTPLLLGTCAEAFAAALEHSRATTAEVEVGDATETSATFRARWT